MQLKDKILYSLVKGELAGNKKFKNQHKGQSCYIFGNGSSLKGMDLQRFGDKIAIGCNSLFVHSDFDKLDCRYYQIPVSLLFYPYRRYYSKFQRNYLGDLYRKKIRQYKNTNYFTSVSNCLSMRADNVSYTHHFGSTIPDINQCEMDGVFSFMVGGLKAMLGTAIYMGFERAVLVGCDYTFSPRYSSHFFEKGNGIASDISDDMCGDPFFAECQKRIELLTITPDGVESRALKFKTYSEYTKSKAEYKENIDIVDAESLEYLDKMGCYHIR